MTNDNPLVDADLITDRDFCLTNCPDTTSGVVAFVESNESVLEFNLSSVISLFAAAKSSLNKINCLY